MGTEITTTGDSQGLVNQMEYAKALAAGDMLPGEYRGKPANVLIAMGLGQSMGLSPAESLYRISVIKGKPTASAELITSKVREAGHKLRVTGDDTKATCTIFRADDPDFAFEVTRDMKWAQQMGLAGNDNYKKQPGTMLKNRAITACARLACPEALYGVAYTPDEMREAAPEAPASLGFGTATVTPADEPEPVEAVVVESDPLAGDDQLASIKAEVKRRSISAAAAKAMLERVTGRDDARTNNLTVAEADAVLGEFVEHGEPDATADTARAAVQDALAGTEAAND